MLQEVPPSGAFWLQIELTLIQIECLILADMMGPNVLHSTIMQLGYAMPWPDRGQMRKNGPVLDSKGRRGLQTNQNCCGNLECSPCVLCHPGRER